MAAPGSATGWSNSSNVIANDGAFAFGTGGYDEGVAYNSPSLVASSFGLTAGAGDTVNGITVQVNARRSGAVSGNLVVYLLRGGVPVGSAKSVALGTGFTTHTFGSSSDAWGAGFTGANLSQLQVGCYVQPTGGGVTAVVEGDIDWLTAAATTTDTTPAAFTFTDQTGVALTTVVTSNAITVSGISAATAISITSGTGEWEKNNSGSWSSLAGTVNNGDTVRVRHVSSGSNNTVTNTTLSIGGVVDTFSSTTLTADSTPDAFTFITKQNGSPSTQYVSNTVTPTGYNSAATVTVSNGSWYKNGSLMGTGAGTISPGDTVAVVGTASASFGGTSTVTLTLGGVAHTYEIQTRAADTTPAAFAFTDVSGVAVSTVQTSNAVTISGIEAAASVSITGGEYEINGSGTWTTAAGSINSGQTIRVRHTSSASLSASVNTVLTVGGVSDTFTSTTVGADSVPDAFSFTAAVRKLPGVLVESDEATITGINVAVGVTCSAGAEVSVEGGAYSTTGTIESGQTVKVRVRASVVQGKTITATVTIGGVSADFDVTTMRIMQPDI